MSTGAKQLSHLHTFKHKELGLRGGEGLWQPGEAQSCKGVRQKLPGSLTECRLTVIRSSDFAEESKTQNFSVKSCNV